MIPDIENNATPLSPAPPPAQEDERVTRILNNVRAANNCLSYICYTLVFILMGIWSLETAVRAVGKSAEEQVALMRVIVEEMKRNRTV